MESLIKLRKFLTNHKTKDGSVVTHTNMGSMRGRYSVPEEKLPVFYKLHEDLSKSVRDQCHFIEMPTKKSIGKIDIDYRFRADLDAARIYTTKHVRRTIEAYNKSFSKYLENFGEIGSAYVFERKKAYANKSGGVSDGFHIMYPGIVGDPEFFHVVRKEAICSLKEIDAFGDLNAINDMESIVDKAVVDSNGWFLYGSGKPGKDPYSLTSIVCPDGSIQESPSCDLEIYNTLSIRRKDEEKNAEFKDMSWKQEVSIKKIAPPIRTNGTQMVQDLSLIYDLVDLLGKKRADDYHAWIRVGFCLHNIGNGSPDFSYLWDEFSKKSEKYTPGACKREWTKLKKVDNSLGIGSLYWWAKKDNPAAYAKLMLDRVDPHLKASVKGTVNGNSYDVALVVRERYPYQHVCVNLERQIWYSFINGIWKVSQKGFYLRKNLSTDIFAEYCRLASYLNNKAVQDDTYLKQAKMSNDVAKKLRTTRFKDTVMRECAELFYDPEFIKKLNSNTDLLGFDNGVYDLSIGVFRETQPDDYITFSTGIDYIPYDPNHPGMDTIHTFFREVFVNEEIKKYMMKFISSVLDGKTTNHLFHFCIGSGGNGKSVLWDWVESCLGNYVQRMPVSLLTQKRASSNAASPELARAAGARLLIFQEPEDNAVFNTGLMKELSSDTIVARMLYSDPIEIIPQWKMIMMCNALPKINSTDGGTWRRVRVVPFESKFVEDPRKPNEFLRRDGILKELRDCRGIFMSYLLEEYDLYKKNRRKLTPPKKILMRTKKYKGSSDTYSSFVNETLVEDPYNFMNIGELYSFFQNYFREVNPNRTIPNRDSFMNYMEENYDDLQLEGLNWRFQLQNKKDDNPDMI